MYSNVNKLKTLMNRLFLVVFFVTEKLSYVVTRDVRPSVRPSSVEITLGRSSDRCAEPIDLKIDINMENWVVHV